MSAEELLSSLQDIAPPPEPAWWMLPPPVWWGACLLLLSIALWRWQRRLRQSAQLGNSLRAELEEIARRQAAGDDDELARELALWLKRAALLAFPGKGLEKLHGAAWIEFLEHSSGLDAFSRGEGRVFADAVYRREVNADGAALLALCRAFLRRIRPQLRRSTAAC